MCCVLCDQSVSAAHDPCKVATSVPLAGPESTGWTREYYGYLMSEASKWSGRHSTMFECVDKDPDAVPGESAHTDPALMYHVEAVCTGIDCPPYHACVMCTK